MDMGVDEEVDNGMDKELDMDMGEEMDTNLTDLTSTALYYIVGLWNIDDQHRNTNMNDN